MGNTDSSASADNTGNSANTGNTGESASVADAHSKTVNDPASAAEVTTNPLPDKVGDTSAEPRGEQEKGKSEVADGNAGVPSKAVESLSGNDAPSSAGAGELAESPDLANVTVLEGAAGTTEIPAASTTNNPVAGAKAMKQGVVTVYESHPSEITYITSQGGYIVAGQSSNGTPMVRIRESFESSLSGASQGVTAVPDADYRFLYWYDASTGEVLTSNTTFVPRRPEEGWPLFWSVQALFDLDHYTIILDPNGATAGGGGGSSGPVRLEAEPGKDFRLPGIASQELDFVKTGYAFAGWDIAFGSGLGILSATSTITDGQVLDAEWLSSYAPAITLVARWVANQVTINYTAGLGGAITLGSGDAQQAASTLQETIDAGSGLRIASAASTISGLQGVSALTSSHYHFVGWKMTGSSIGMSAEEASNPVLSANTIERLSRYADSATSSPNYHALSFKATFAPNIYMFNYGANGGVGEIAAGSLTYGRGLATASAGMTREGYKLSSWNSTPDGSGTSFALGETLGSAAVDLLIDAGVLSDENEASTTLYAQWTAETKPTPTPDPEPEPEPVKPTEPTKPSVPVEPSEPVEPSTPDEPEPDEPDEPSTPADPVKPAEPTTPTDPSDEPKEPADEPDEPKDEPSEKPRQKTATRPVPGANLLDALLNPAPATTPKPNNDKPAPSEPKSGLLSKGGNGRSGGPVVIQESYGGGSAAYGDDGLLSQLMSPEGMQTAGTAVVAVAAVGAIAGLVGVGVSMAGAAMMGAAAIGTASTIGLTSAADLAADLVASAAAGAGAAAAANAGNRRRREDMLEEEGEDNADDEQ